MTEQIKIKPLTKEQIIISVDRLTRFKPPKEKYLRVFCDILTHNLISPMYKKSELESMDFGELTNLAQYVINYSLDFENNKTETDYKINNKLYDYENSVFKLNSEDKKLLQNKINYDAILKYIDEKSPVNLRWLRSLSNNTDIKIQRQEKSLKYPIELLVIVEGATEEILLPEFAQICGTDFDKEGIYVLSAGGKNQVVKMYYEWVEQLNIPIFVLLDKDALQNSHEIEAKLRNFDMIHLLECGEFEDLLPFELIKRTLDYELQNISIVEQNLYSLDIPRAKFLEEVFKKRGMHEFKKVEFAQMVKNRISSKSDASPEIIAIIEEINKLKSNC